MQYEEIIKIFNEASLEEQKEILKNALTQDPLIALTIFKDSSLEVMYKLITNLQPLEVVAFFEQCWNHLGQDDQGRFDYLAKLFIRLWQSFPDSTYATHLLIWIFLSEYSFSPEVVIVFVSTLKSANYPIPDNLLLNKKEE